MISGLELLLAEAGEKDTETSCPFVQASSLVTPFVGRIFWSGVIIELSQGKVHREFPLSLSGTKMSLSLPIIRKRRNFHQKQARGKVVRSAVSPILICRGLQPLLWERVVGLDLLLFAIKQMVLTLLAEGTFCLELLLKQARRKGYRKC